MAREERLMARVKFKFADGIVGQVPTRGSMQSAGWDIRACEAAVVPSGKRVKIRTGLMIEIPKGYCGLIPSRSGLACNRGVTVINSPGLIDSDYRGEIWVTLLNTDRDPLEVSVGERIAQIVIVKHEEVTWEEGDLSQTERGEKGLGSTGTR